MNNTEKMVDQKIKNWGNRKSYVKSSSYIIEFIACTKILLTRSICCMKHKILAHYFIGTSSQPPCSDTYPLWSVLNFFIQLYKVKRKTWVDQQKKWGKPEWENFVSFGNAGAKPGGMGYGLNLILIRFFLCVSFCNWDFSLSVICRWYSWFSRLVWNLCSIFTYGHNLEAKLCKSVYAMLFFPIHFVCFIS